MDFFKNALESRGESDLKNEVQGFTSSQSGGSTTDPTNAPSGTNAPAPGAGAASGTNFSDLEGNAQTLYTGFSDELSGKQSNIDNQQLAKAGADLLGAADDSSYVKDSQYGQYVNKAEQYLDKYGNPTGGAPAQNDPSAVPSGGANAQNDPSADPSYGR